MIPVEHDFFGNINQQGILSARIVTFGGKRFRELREPTDNGDICQRAQLSKLFIPIQADE